MRAIWLVAGLSAAMLITGTAFASKPVPSGNVTLGITGCSVSISWDWAAAPGPARTYDVSLENDVNGTSYHPATGPRTRSGSGSASFPLTSDTTTKNFTVRLRFYDRNGVGILGFSSNTVAANCV